MKIDARNSFLAPPTEIRIISIMSKANFALPDIKTVGCVSFTACGRFSTKDKRLLKLLDKESAFIAANGKGRLRRLVRLGMGKAGHLHVDVATSDFFHRTKPKATHSWLAIQDVLRNFIGQEIEVNGKALFTIPFADLPKEGLIRTLSFESRSPKMAAKLIGGTFSLENAPIHQITWSRKTDGKVDVFLNSAFKTRVGENYLKEIFAVFSTSFQMLILEDA